MLLGAALWRLDYSLLAFNPGNGYHYFPSAAEVLISWAFVAIEGVCLFAADPAAAGTAIT